MSKRNMAMIVAAVIVVAAVLTGVLVYHNSHKKSNTTSNNTTTTTPPASTSSSPAVNNSVLLTKTKSGIGQYLTDPQNDTLYTYQNDTSGVSNCSGSCISTWPPYVDKGSTTNLPTNISTIKRSDNGEVQYTYKGLPLYTFISDSQGQVSGNGVAGFSVAKP